MCVASKHAQGMLCLSLRPQGMESRAQAQGERERKREQSRNDAHNICMHLLVCAHTKWMHVLFVCIRGVHKQAQSFYALHML